MLNDLLKGLDIVMKIVFYCQNCRKAFSRDADYKGECPNCGGKLYNTQTPVDLWKLNSDEQKEGFKQKWDLLDLNEQEKKKLQEQEQKQIENDKSHYALSKHGQYEYDVQTSLNIQDGRVDTEAIKTILNTKAKQGWKLHTMYSNELGKNALTLLNVNSNATVSEDVMIFERVLNPEN